MKAFEGAAAALAELGTGTFFGLMGDGNMRMTLALEQSGRVRYVAAVHEAGAVAAADGYHRSTGELGLATITHGPGLTNAVTAIAEASRNRSAVLVVTSEPPAHRQFAQHIDVASVVHPTGALYEVARSTDDVRSAIFRAARAARTERRPVVLNLPLDVVNTEETELAAVVGTAISAPALSISPRGTEAIQRELLRSERPLILAGRGARGARTEIGNLADVLRAPILTTLLERDAYSSHHRGLGVAGGLAFPPADQAIESADLLLVFGAGLNHFTTQYGRYTKGKRIVQVDNDPQAFGLHVEPDVAVVADAAVAAAHLSINVASAEREWAADFHTQLATFSPLNGLELTPMNGVVDAREALILIDQVLPPARTVVTDTGRFVMAAWKYLSTPPPGRLIHTCTFASIGLGLATAVGVASSGRPTVAVVGDGGLMMSLGEITTVSRNTLPMKILVVNDGSYGAEHMRLRQYGDDPSLSLMSWPNIATIAESCGIPSRTICTREDIAAAHDLLAADGPALLDIRTDPSLDYGDW